MNIELERKRLDQQMETIEMEQSKIEEQIQLEAKKFEYERQRLEETWKVEERYDKYVKGELITVLPDSHYHQTS